MTRFMAVFFFSCFFFLTSCQWDDNLTEVYPWLEPPRGYDEGETGWGDPEYIGPPEEGSESVPSQERMIFIPGGTYVLGEWDEEMAEDYPLTVIREAEYVMSPYFVATFPFPGGEGDPWPTDALYVEQMETLVATLLPTGWRLCTMGELMLAAAGPDNWRYPYNPEEWVEGKCEHDDANPTPNALGAWEECVSPVGARDFMVRSSWGVIDPVTAAGLAPYVGEDLTGEFAVYGGVSRDDTFYAPNNFGVHTHDPDPEASFWDDSLRLCKSWGSGLDPRRELAWQDLRESFLASGASYEAWLGVGHN